MEALAFLRMVWSKALTERKREEQKVKNLIWVKESEETDQRSDVNEEKYEMKDRDLVSGKMWN